MRVIKLTGTINAHYEGEDVLRKAMEAGAFNAAIMSREIVVETAHARLKKVRDTLHAMHVTDLRVREESALESTVTHSGHGHDQKKCIKVSLAPATRVTGIRFLSFIFSDGFKRDSLTDPAILSSSTERVITELLKKAGVTDALVGVEFRALAENIDSAVEHATVNALVDADGIIQVTN